MPKEGEGGGGGGKDSGFQVTRMFEWGKSQKTKSLKIAWASNKTPKKSLHQKF